MVLDARQHKFTWDKTGLRNLSDLPDYKKDPPAGSLALVAWTASTYPGKNDQSALGCSLNWVAVLHD